MKGISAAVLVAAGALVLTACQTTNDSRTINGTPIQHTEWRDTTPQESAFQFAGPRSPTAVAWQYRIRDNQLTEERIRFSTGASVVTSSAFLQTTPPGQFFNEETTTYWRDKNKFLESVAKLHHRTDGYEAKTGSNRNGTFLYAILDYGDGTRCLAARQGLGENPRGVRWQPGTHFNALVSFSYCDKMTEAELLEVFGSLRPKLP